MSLTGARGIVRVSQNLVCEVQAAMVVEATVRRGGKPLKEPDFYQLVMAQEYPGEYGEREAARRRGAKFEANLIQNDAALLRQAVAPLYGLDPEALTVRNFENEVPGGSWSHRKIPTPAIADRNVEHQVPSALHAVRLSRTRRVLRDLAAGRPVPDLLIQPQLRLATGPGRQDYVHISPDFAILDPAAQMYVPGEMKSFVVRANAADAGDLERTRRQAAVEIEALRAEAMRVGLADRVTNRAAFVFGTPWGLKPHPAFQEPLDGPVRDVARALQLISATKIRLNAMRSVDGARFEMLVDELQPNLQEKCVGTCVLVDYCKTRAGGRARLLGDSAVDLLGDGVDLDRFMALVRGAPPTDAEEARLTADLIDAIHALGFDAQTLRRPA